LHECDLSAASRHACWCRHRRRVRAWFGPRRPGAARVARRRVGYRADRPARRGTGVGDGPLPRHRGRADQPPGARGGASRRRTTATASSCWVNSSSCRRHWSTGWCHRWGMRILL